MAKTDMRERSNKTAMVIEWRRLDSIRPYPKNARKITQRAIDAVAKSITEFGWRQPIVVDKEGVIVIGHVRRLAAIQLALLEVPVHVCDLPANKIRALRLMDNRSHDEAQWDPEILTAEMLELRGLDLDLSMTGFSSRELDALLRVDRPDEDDVPPVPEAVVTKPGDLWLMGEHRLLCGDSTKADEVARVMNGRKASLFATDPPYLVDYKGGDHPQSWQNKAEVKDKHWDDYVDPKNEVEFYEGYLRLGLQHSIDRVPVYQWHADLRRVVVAEAWTRVGLLLHQIIVWVKARPVLTRSHFMWQHEPCAYGWQTGNMPVKPPANEHTVWQINQIGESDGIHPTQKPVALAEKPILFHLQPGELCYEPFSGSGTTLIGAQKNGRVCYGLEISPAFCDVIVQRWNKFTGCEATLESHGTTYAQTKDGRLREWEDAIKEEVLG